MPAAAETSAASGCPSRGAAFGAHESGSEYLAGMEAIPAAASDCIRPSAAASDAAAMVCAFVLVGASATSNPRDMESGCVVACLCKLRRSWLVVVVVVVVPSLPAAGADEDAEETGLGLSLLRRALAAVELGVLCCSSHSENKMPPPSADTCSGVATTPLRFCCSFENRALRRPCERLGVAGLRGRDMAMVGL